MITKDDIKAAGGIVHSDGNIFFRDISMLQGLAVAAPAAVAGPAMDVTLDEDQAGLLRDMLGDREAHPEAITVRLLVGDGHSGHGLYVAQAEYQDEGAVLLASLPAPAAPPGFDAWWERAGDGRSKLMAKQAWHAALAAAPQAPAAPSGIAAQVIENLIALARIVNVAVEDWGETKEDGSMEVTLHKEEADKMESILEFFESLPDAPESEGVILSGPSRAARVLRAQAAPAAPAVDAELLELAQAIVKYNRQHGGVLAVHINNLADLVDERAAIAAQAKEGGAQ